ncbi:hypothetical protein Tco_0989114 [Tanacetum coccineum]|uniref:Uncharacterized protein n=1 Tax=Tanacetum coccineum TaxID=301880 RepID=A0ABQ5ETV0_9ASTR
MTLEGVNAIVTELAAVQEQDTQDIYVVIEDGQDRQTQLSREIDVLDEDRQFHYETARLLDQEALVSREAWAHSVGLSSAVHYELQAYRAHTQMQDYRIASQESLTETLIAQVSLLQGQLSADSRPDYGTSGLEIRLLSAALANHETLRNSTNGHGDRSHNFDTRIRGTVPTPCECTYKDFLNCKPLTFKGTEGVVVMSQWFEKMESVFHIRQPVLWRIKLSLLHCTVPVNLLSHGRTPHEDWSSSCCFCYGWKE